MMDLKLYAREKKKIVMFSYDFYESIKCPLVIKLHTFFNIH